MGDPQAHTSTVNDDAPDSQGTAPVQPLKNSDPEKVCQNTCRYDGKSIGTARQAGHVLCLCSLCYHSFHKDCVNFPNVAPAFWVCPHCRSLAAEVKSLHTKLDEVLAQNASLTQILVQQQTLLTSFTTLETKVTALYSNLVSDSDDDDDQDDDDVDPRGTLLIGDSLIRDVVPKDDTLTTDCTGGATLSTIRKKLKTINPKRRRYEKIFIVAGTNDSASKRPIEKIAEESKNMVDAAKLVCDEVVLSSIPPRADNHANKTKIDAINEHFQALSDANENVSLKNHDDNFLFRDNSVDTTLLLSDNLHLSTSGVKKLLTNLNLSEKAEPKNVNLPTRKNNTWPTSQPSTVPPLMSLPTPPTLPLTNSCPTPQAVYFHGGGSPLSNFFETPLNIWNMNFRSSEHAFQYRKCVSTGNKTTANDVLRAPTPLLAKRTGDKITTNNTWEDTKQGAMYEILRAKSRQCPQFVQALKDSNERPLIEDTPNPYWGRGRDSQGLNMLGRLLMTLRSELSMSRPQNFTPRPAVTPPRNFHGNTQPHSKQQQLRCFNCGEASHTKSTCRHGSPLRCYSCRGLGHKQKFCRGHQ